MKKVLLLNPPGRQLYVRDYFCSKVSQADNLLQPIDLVMLSGTLAQEHEVSFIDAIAGRLSADTVLKTIKEINPIAVITLMGSASLKEDALWIQTLKEAMPHIRIMGIGDVFMEEGERLLADFPALDAIITDFTTPDILFYLRGEHDHLAGMIIRGKDGRPAAIEKHERIPCFDAPVPRHELFLPYHYRHSMIRAKKFVSMIIDYGCPFPCSFCIMNKLGYKFRKTNNVLDELRYIRQLGVKEIFFATQTFGANKEAAREICEAMIREKFNFGWVCFSRVDVATPDFLDLTKRAGCHSIIFGVESASDRILAHHNKKYTVRQIMETMDYCRKIGIETSGTFILGLPEEDHATMRETLSLLKKIKLDYAGINVAVPRLGTELREQALAQNLVQADFRIMDQSGTTVAMPTKHLTVEEVAAYRRKAIRTFYFRPGYIFRRLYKMRFADITKTLRNMMGLIKTTWFNRTDKTENSAA